MPTKIQYDPTLHGLSGYLRVGDGAPPMREADRKTLLYLLFWLCSDQEGREFLDIWKESAGKNEAAVRAALIDRFENKFGVTGAVRDALVNGHLAADRFVKATKDLEAARAANKPETDPVVVNAIAERDRQEQIYLQMMSTVLWQLQQDVSNHEFSLLW